MLYRALFGLVLIACVLVASRARADPPAATSAPDGDRCIAHHKEAQILRAQGSLLTASKELQRCLHPACSPVLREACAALLEEVERDTPSIVFAAESDGVDLTDVRVYDGGALLFGRITGRAVALDPGVHQLRFEANGKQPLDKTIVLRVGEKNRTVNANLPALERSAKLAPPPSVSRGAVPAVAPVTPSRPTGESPARALSFADYAPFGVGLLLGVAGLVVALDARGDLEDAKRTCSPLCSDARQERILGKSLAADGLFVLTGAAFAYGTFRIVTREPDASPAAAIIIEPGYVGGRVRF
jgi:hypothetical protein